MVTGFFDFLGRNEGAGLRYGPRGVSRLNWRYQHIIEPIKDALDGARVLELGSHDGRWSYAFADAGATVTGIEGRADLIAQFQRYPETEANSRIAFLEGDFLTEMDRLAAQGATFDVVACLGVFYHTIQHYRMLMQMVAFQPKIIVVDGVFHLSQRPIIAMTREDTDLDRASIPQRAGQAQAPVGRVSRSALELMVASLDYTVEWNHWDVPASEREPVNDYFERAGNRLRRFTCFLSPLSDHGEMVDEL